MVKKVNGGYQVVSEKSGKNLGGPYKTKEEACQAPAPGRVLQASEGDSANRSRCDKLRRRRLSGRLDTWPIGQLLPITTFQLRTSQCEIKPLMTYGSLREKDSTTPRFSARKINSAMLAGSVNALPITNSPRSRASDASFKCSCRKGASPRDVIVNRIVK